MVREEVISTLLGYTSIGCWLCAQFPQMHFTWRRKSVDGLALSLLANWLLGDTTNLIGCILTDQLPFQTHLAAYFVFIDICLVCQFLHYDRRPQRHATSTSVVKSSESSAQSRTSLVTYSSLLETQAFPCGQPFRSRSVSHFIDPDTAVTDVTLPPAELDYRHEGFITSEVDVHSSQHRWRNRGGRRASSLMGLPESVVADPERHWGTRRYISLERDDARDESSATESESTPTVLRESCHSEDGRRACGRNKHVSWTRENPGGHNLSQLESQLLDGVEPRSGTALSTVRGRQLTRSNVHNSLVVMRAPSVSETATDSDLPQARWTSASSAVSAAASRRSASLVCLAVFALFGFSSSPLGVQSSTVPVGRVMSIIPRSTPDTSVSLLSAHPTPLSIVTAPDSVVHLSGDVVELILPSKDVQRLIGRVSAWTCTTLYITSRLPQIWKNFVRKSVEGLSMYLFIFAFLGNFFYVLSILSNPKMDLPEPQASQFIRDSIPYILGSGGTLLFDVTILLQSLVYDPRRCLLRNKKAGRKRSLLLGVSSEEERRVLLEADPRVEDAC